jgi:hypothetical protein
MDWVSQAHDRDRWRAVVNAVMNIRGSRKMRGISSLAENLLAPLSQLDKCVFRGSASLCSR